MANEARPPVAEDTTLAVWKFPVWDGGDYSDVDMPVGAQILTVQFQEGSGACIWALVDPQRSIERRRFRIAGTGHPINDPLLHYLGTFQMMGGALIFHVFEIAAPAEGER